MNKKFLVTLATAATVTLSGFGAMSADASSNIPTTQGKYENGSTTIQYYVYPLYFGNGTLNPCPNLKPEWKPEIKPENKPEVKPEEKPESKPEEKPESKPEVKPEVKPEEKPENKPEVKPEEKPEVTPPTTPPTNPDQNKPGNDQSKPEQDQPSSAVSAFEQKVVELTNVERQKQGLKPLAMDVELSKVARVKSQDMKDNNYFDHNSPTYGSPFDMMKKFGISYNYAGENIAQGQRSPEEVVQAWMNSQGHRENIMNPNYTHIGVGHVEANNYWTQMFVGR